MIFGDFGTNFHDFCCPGDWLEIWWLFRVMLGSPQILRPSWLVVNGLSPVPITNIQDPWNEAKRPWNRTWRSWDWARSTRDTWNTGLHRTPRSLVAPDKQILGIVASASWHLWYANLSFGMIGCFTLACWGTLGQFWDIGEHKNNKTTLWGPGLDFYWFLVDFGTHGCHLACLEPLLWRPGGPWDDPGAILERSWDDAGTLLGHWRAQGKTLWGPGLDFVDFLMILGTHSESFLGILRQKNYFFHIYFRVVFSVGCCV